MVESGGVKCNMLRCMSIIHVFFRINVFLVDKSGRKEPSRARKLECRQPTYILPCLNYGRALFVPLADPDRPA